MRWNSSFDMLQRLTEQSEAISAAAFDQELKHLHLRDSLFTANEQGLVEEILSVLKPMKRATAFVSGDKQPTASRILPTLAKLKLELQEKTRDTLFTSKMKEAMRENLDSRYTNATVRNLFKISYLDPRYKDMTSASECETFKAKQAVKEIGLSIAESKSKQVDESPATSDYSTLPTLHPTVKTEPDTDYPAATIKQEPPEKKVKVDNMEYDE